MKVFDTAAKIMMSFITAIMIGAIVFQKAIEFWFEPIDEED